MVTDPLRGNADKHGLLARKKQACRGWSFDGFYYTWEARPPKCASRYSRWPDYTEPHISLRLSLTLPCNGEGGVVE